MEDKKFSLSWKDFDEHVRSSYKDLKFEETFTDARIVCKDTKPLATHKVILANCSPVLKGILKDTPGPNPIIYLTKIMGKHLKLMMDFMYLGNVQVDQTDLDGFLAVAEELKVKGLSKEPECVTQSAIEFEIKIQRTITGLCKKWRLSLMH